MQERFEQLAKRLADGWVNGTTIALPPAEEAPGSRQEAYDIQDRMAELIGQPVVGWKVGAAIKTVQLFEGHDGPLPGRIFADRYFDNDATVPAALYPAAKIETEFAFKLTTELPDNGTLVAADLRDKLAFHPAIELSSSRWAPGTGNRSMTTFDGIADNGTSGAVVLGDEVTDWQDFAFEVMELDSRIDGSPPIQAYSGAFRRNPVEIAAETLNDLRARGVDFTPGMCLLTGSLTLPTPLRPGQTLTTRVAEQAPITLKLT